MGLHSNWCSSVSGTHALPCYSSSLRGSRWMLEHQLLWMTNSSLQNGGRWKGRFISWCRHLAWVAHPTSTYAHWLEYSHMVTANCKGSWAVMFLTGNQVPIWKLRIFLMKKKWKIHINNKHLLPRSLRKLTRVSSERLGWVPMKS